MLGISTGLMYQSASSAPIIAASNQGIAMRLQGAWQGSGYDTSWLSFGDCLNLGTNDFTISCWFKYGPHTLQNGSENEDVIIFYKNGTNSVTSENTGAVGMYLSGGYLKFIVHDGSGYIINNKTSETDLTDFLAGTGPITVIYNHDKIPVNTWTHFCVSADRSGNCVLYLNGSPFENFSTIDISSDSSENFDNKGHWKIGTTDGIGALPHTYGFPNTFFDEYGIWNSALDADNVAAIYNSGNPINLLVNSGNYDESSALQAYWKFGDGVGDVKTPITAAISGTCRREYHIIRDQKNNGFSSELWDATQPSTGSWTAYGNNTVAVDDGAVKITCVDNEHGAKALLSNATNLSADLSTGDYNEWDSARHWYKLSCEVKVNSGSSVHLGLDANTTDSGYLDFTDKTITPVTSTEFVELDIYFEGRHATNQHIAFKDMSVGEIIWIKDVSIKKLNGNNGATEYNFLDDNSCAQDGYVEFTSDAPLPAQT